jgi:hypothetical protein
MESEFNILSTTENMTEEMLKIIREKFSRMSQGSNHGALVYDKQNDKSKCTSSVMKGTGGYADFIFRFAASALFDYDIPIDEPLPWKKGGPSFQDDNSHPMRSRGKRSASSDDNAELCLFRSLDGTFSFQQKSNDDETLLKFATAYGFKNIQLLVSKVATNNVMKMHSYHYVEAMACPSGCLNGGGQVRNFKRERPSDTRERVNQMSNFVEQVIPWQIQENMDVTNNKSSYPQEHLHTRFHVVPKLELSSGVTSGIAIDDTNW